MMQWIKAHQWQLGVGVLWLILLLLVNRYMTANDLTFAELLGELEIVFMRWYGPILYVVIYFLRPVVFLPASLLAILAGSMWGLGLGFIFGLIAGTLSAVLPYAFGRWFAREDTVEAENQNWQTRFTDMIRHNPFQAVLTMRLLYFPYDAVSVVVGVLRIPFLSFITATAIGNIIGTLSFVGIGASLEGDISQGDVSINPLVFLFSFLLLAVSIGLSRYLKSRNEAVDV